MWFNPWKPKVEEEEEVSGGEKREEKLDFEQEIEIGDLRGLEEDERIIIVPPKEESTVEGKTTFCRIIAAP